MLGNLLKYELKATGRIILPFFGGLLGITFLFRLFSVFDTGPALREFSYIVEGLAITIFVVLIISTFVVNFIVMLMRFYKNLFSDEGYLMNTLPVSPAANIWAKAFSSAIWTLASVAVASLTGFIFFFGDYLFDIGDALGEFWTAFQYEILPYITAADSAWIGIILTELIIMILIGLVSSPMLCYMCITLGQRFSRHKVLGAFGVYLIVSFLVQTVGAVFTAVIGNTTLPRQFYRFIDSNPGGGSALIFTFFLIWSIVCLLVPFFITNHQLNTKLNLE